MDRKAKAQWKGDLMSGAGTISTASGVLSATPYSFKTRFEQGVGTNPEELLAAAHAGCFSMALSLMLQNEGLKADSIDTSCTVSLEKDGEGFSITRSHLVLEAKVPGATEEVFTRVTNAAKEGCPVSKLYDTEIILDAKLVS
jgi:osmotically inducible protein OsmC